jgi:hypothetical protein
MRRVLGLSLNAETNNNLESSTQPRKTTESVLRWSKENCLKLITMSLGTIALQGGSSRVRILMVLLEFLIVHNSSGRTTALGSIQPLIEMSTRNISCGVKAAGAQG